MTEYELLLFNIAYTENHLAKWLNTTNDAYLCKPDEWLQLSCGDGCAVICLMLTSQVQVECLQNLGCLGTDTWLYILTSIPHILQNTHRKTIYLKDLKEQDFCQVWKFLV